MSEKIYKTIEDQISSTANYLKKIIKDNNLEEDIDEHKRKIDSKRREFLEILKTKNLEKLNFLEFKKKFFIEEENSILFLLGSKKEQNFVSLGAPGQPTYVENKSLKNEHGKYIDKNGKGNPMLDALKNNRVKSEHKNITDEVAEGVQEIIKKISPDLEEYNAMLLQGKELKLEEYVGKMNEILEFCKTEANDVQEKLENINKEKRDKYLSFQYELNKNFTEKTKEELYSKEVKIHTEKIKYLFSENFFKKYLHINFEELFSSEHTRDTKKNTLETLLQEKSNILDELEKKIEKSPDSKINAKQYEIILDYILLKIAKNVGIHSNYLAVLGDKIKIMTGYKDLLLNEKNIILRGAPGTGKTYLAKDIAAQVVTNGKELKYESLSDTDKEKIGFVQFHPSYDYTDFVEGLRPVNKDENIGFEYKPGIFREFVAKAIKDEGNKYEGNKYVFIIDEINRGEISKILGELFYSIDPGYRGKSGKVLTQYSNMIEDKHNVEKEFYIPENVYIIGTMNDIDRSVDTFDFAMRRRFAFKEVTAEDSAKNMGVDQTKVYESMKALNDKIISVEVGLSKDYQIGASYFKSISDKNLSDKKLEDELKNLWNNKLEPLFRDYLRGEFDIDGKIKKLEEVLIPPMEKGNKNSTVNNVEPIEEE